MNFQTTNNFIKSNDVLFTNYYRDNTFYKITEIDNNILDIIDEFIFIIDLPEQIKFIAISCSLLSAIS